LLQSLGMDSEQNVLSVSDPFGELLFVYTEDRKIGNSYLLATATPLVEVSHHTLV